jgi:phosphopentomutase
MPTNNRTVLAIVIDAVSLDRLENHLGRYDGALDYGNLCEMGLGNLLPERFHYRVPPNPNAQFAHSLEQASKSPDSVIGHQEIAGIINLNAYELFENGFPEPYLKAIEGKTGRRFFFNRICGGVKAIRDNGDEHKRTGNVIVYASQCDPLIQFAAHEDIVSPEELARIADIAFEVAPEYGVRITRSISRPWTDRNGVIKRLTERRHDRSLPVKQNTLLHVLDMHGIYTTSVGKPAELVDVNCWKSMIKEKELDTTLDLRFVDSEKRDTNPYSVQGTLRALKEAGDRGGKTFVFVNFVDTDSLTGHEIVGDGTPNVRDTLKSVEETSRCLRMFRSKMKSGDIIIVTADHGMEERRIGGEAFAAADGMMYGIYGYHAKHRVPILAQMIDGDMNEFTLPSTKTFASTGHLIAQAYSLEDEFAKSCGLEAHFI